MMVDASALLSILFEETDGIRLKQYIATAPGPHAALSPVNYFEAAERVDKLPVEGKSRELDNLIAAVNIQITTVTPEQAHLARQAYRKFGKGNHPARLNIGDCFAYALAKARNEPLLFKGDDFRLTDIEAAI
jgi:ribonuclease VapC